MLSASSNQNESGVAGDATAQQRVPATLTFDPTSVVVIESDGEPRWGKFLRHWESLKSAKGRVPARGDIDPTQLVRLLPNIFIVDVVTEDRKKPRFRYRLLGQAILDREVTRPGAFLDELGQAADIAGIERQYLAAMQGKVSIRTRTLAWSDSRKGMFKYAVMILPLSDDGLTANNLIGLVLYDF